MAASPGADYSLALLLDADFSRELTAVAETVEELAGVSPEGVLALGEIASNGMQSLEFFNKTFAIAITRG